MTELDLSQLNTTLLLVLVLLSAAGVLGVFFSMLSTPDNVRMVVPKTAGCSIPFPRRDVHLFGSAAPGGED